MSQLLNHPTFYARYLPSGDLALQCKQTQERFIVGPKDARGDCYAYREGELLRHGPRAMVIDAVESAARWSLRK